MMDFKSATRGCFNVMKVGLTVGTALGLFRILIFRIGTWTPVGLMSHVVHALLLIVTATVVMRLMVSHPTVRGSGLPQLKAALIGRMDLSQKWFVGIRYVVMFWLNMLGLAVGSAGPAIQMGACLSKKVVSEDANTWLKTGAACGLASFLGTPLAALALAYEELALHPTGKNYRKLIPSVLIS